MSLQSSLGAIKSSRLQLAALALTLGYLICTVGSGLAFQDAERVINQHKHAESEPLKIVSVKINNEPRALNKSFTSNGEWLRGTKLGLRNDSNKDVIYIDFRLNFPETLSSGNEMSFGLELGNMPGLPVYRDPLFLRPGDEITLPLTDKDYQGLPSLLRLVRNYPR